jgi:hypothetical protein
MITNRTVLALCAAALACSTAACASAVSRHTDPKAAFPDALHACRSLQPGRAIRKFQLPPTHPQIAECLSHRGWSADGTRENGDSGSRTK